MQRSGWIPAKIINFTVQALNKREMKFNVGDRVKFLNDVGGGHIQSIDRNLAYVLTEDGFEIPMSISELILVEPVRVNPNTAGSTMQPVPELKNIPELKRVNPVSDSSNELHEQEELPDSGKNPVFSILYGVLPGRRFDLRNESTDLYLINDSEFNLYFNLGLVDEQYLRSLQSGLLEADTKLFIASFSREELNEFPVFRVQGLFLRKSMHLSYSPLNIDFQIDLMELFSSDGFTENDFFDQKAYIRPLKEEKHWSESILLDDESLRSKDSPGQVKPSKVPSLPDTEEVDLHIHELVETHAGLSNAEILEIQMSRFQHALEGAIRSKTKRIIFIHGVGNGKLKFEIRKDLDRKYPRLKYQDASFREYGFGATMVFLRK